MSVLFAVAAENSIEKRDSTAARGFAGCAATLFQMVVDGKCYDGGERKDYSPK